MKEKQNMDKMSPTLVKAIHALKDKERRSIVYAIDAKKTTVEELCSGPGLDLATVERQLKVLEECGMVIVDRKVGRVSLTSFCEHFLKVLFLSLDPSNLDASTKELLETKRGDPIGEAIKEYRNGRSTWKGLTLPSSSGGLP